MQRSANKRGERSGSSRCSLAKHLNNLIVNRHAERFGIARHYGRECPDDVICDLCAC
jgi:hypothetical protein